MRSTKIFISAVAFIAAFVFSVVFVGLLFGSSQSSSHFVYKKNCSQQYAENISALIRQDVKNGRTRGKKLYQIDKDFRPPFTNPTFADYSGAVTEYVDASHSIYAGNLPHDFQYAWREHLRAWRNYSDFLESMKYASEQSKQFEEETGISDARYSQEINRTWDEVLRIAREYNADFR